MSTLRRRLAAAAGRERRPHAPMVPPGEWVVPATEAVAGDADLDVLRGELVHALDRLAAADTGCSASFRRI